MNILKNLHSSLQIDAHEAAASLGHIEKLKEFSSIAVPADYLSVIEEMTEVEMLIDGTTN